MKPKFNVKQLTLLAMLYRIFCIGNEISPILSIIVISCELVNAFSASQRAFRQSKATACGRRAFLPAASPSRFRTAAGAGKFRFSRIAF